MTTTPETLTWTPGDGLEALLAIRDRVRAAQDAELERERMTVTMEGGDWRAIHEAPPRINADGDLICVSPVTPYGAPHDAVSRVEWTPPTDPEPAWADADVVIAAGDYPDGAFNLRQRRDSGWSTPFWTGTRDTQQVAEAYRLDGTTPVALIRTVDGKPRVCAEAILALGVDNHGALYDAWVHNTVGRSVWDWLRDLGGDDQ